MIAYLIERHDTIFGFGPEVCAVEFDLRSTVEAAVKQMPYPEDRNVARDVARKRIEGVGPGDMVHLSSCLAVRCIEVASTADALGLLGGPSLL
jgi:hypothetical protein